MNRFRKLTYTLPASWACLLINGDDSGMEQFDALAVEKFLESEGLPSPVSCSEESFFSHRHDAWKFLPYSADCLDFTFLLPR